MSVADVTARINEIQAQLSTLRAGFASPPVTGPVGQVSTQFQAELNNHLAGVTTSSATTGASGAAKASAATPVGGAGDGSPLAQKVVAEAKKYLGIPYLWGGTDPKKGLDCSGLVQLVYSKLGIDLPRVSYQQATAGRPVDGIANARPGDLVFFDNSSSRPGIDHVGIYIGDGKMIEAPRTGLDVRIVDVYKTPTAIRRVLPESAYAAAAAPASGASGSVGGAPFADLFQAAGRKYGLDPALLSAVAKAESSYNPRAVSHAGAQGLMQLMPATAQGLGVADPFNPAQAVDGAAKLLSSLHQKFGSFELALAAYNAGPGAVTRHDGIPPYAETQNYVRKVMATWRG